MALKEIKPVLDGNPQVNVEYPGSLGPGRKEIPAKALFKQKRDTASFQPASNDDALQEICLHCGKMHELKQTLWLVENARLVEINVTGFFYCAQVNQVFIAEQ